MRIPIPTLLTLTVLLCAPAFPQADPTPGLSAQERIAQLERALAEVMHRAEMLETEKGRLLVINAEEREEAQSHRIRAIESEVKAAAIAKTWQVAIQDLEDSKEQVKNQLEAKLFVSKQQLMEIKGRVSSLDEQLAQALAKPERVEGLLKTAIFISKNMDSNTLTELAGEALGEMVSFTETDAQPSQVGRGRRQRFTPYSAGNQILVIDFEDRINKAIELLVKIDDSFIDDDNMSRETAEPQTLVYTPKALTAKQVLALIEPDPRMGRSKLYVQELPGSGNVRIVGPKDLVAKALALLQTTDRYAPQVRLRAWLITTTSTPDQAGVPLPDKLLSGLREALPGKHFSGQASMLVQTSVGQGQQVRAVTFPSHTSESMPVQEWVLTAGMKSYDSKAGLLALQQCSFQVDLVSRVERLSADLLLHRGEFTVVGSIQGGSMYLVLTFEEV